MRTAGSDALTVLVVDDHPIFRRGLRAILERAPWVGRVLETAGAREATRLAVTEDVDVVVMDLALPDGTGLQATEQILRTRPSIRILALTLTNDPTTVEKLLTAGARGYVLKDNDPETVLDAVHAVARGALVLAPGVDVRPLTSSQLTSSPLDQLSPREREVLRELATGGTNAQIARRLGLAEKSVRNYLSAVFTKLQVSDRTQAALFARDAGLHR